MSKSTAAQPSPRRRPSLSSESSDPSRTPSEKRVAAAPAPAGRTKAGSKSKVGESSAADARASLTKTPPKKKKARPKPLIPLEILLGEKLKNSKGDEVSPKTFAERDGVVGLYFAAHWCPPCRTFSPMLKLLYDELKKKDENFEVVFVSFDNTEQSFNDYLSKMPWYAVDYNEEEKREQIAMNYGIHGIPVLILIKSTDCELITLNGRDIVMVDPTGERFPWDVLLTELEEQQATIRAMANGAAAGSQGPPPSQKADDAKISEPQDDAAKGAQDVSTEKREPPENEKSIAKNDPKNTDQSLGKAETTGNDQPPEKSEPTQNGNSVGKNSSNEKSQPAGKTEPAGKDISKNASTGHRDCAPVSTLKRMSSGGVAMSCKGLAKKRSI